MKISSPKTVKVITCEKLHLLSKKMRRKFHGINFVEFMIRFLKFFFIEHASGCSGVSLGYWVCQCHLLFYDIVVDFNN